MAGILLKVFTMRQESSDVIPRKRIWLKPLLILAFIALALAGGWRFYENWKLRSLVEQARVLTDQGDYRQAMLALQRALQIRPASAAATRGMAELSDRLGFPLAVEWRRAASELSPKSTTDSLALASSALRHRQTDLAERALKDIEEEGRGSAQFHATAGNAAVAAGHYAKAEEHFAKALEIEPQNAGVEYNLAVTRVQSPDPKKRAAALETLARLAEGGKMDVLARRTLITRLQREKKWEEALRWSTRQIESAAVEFRDRLAHLDLLRATESKELDAAVTTAETAFAKAADVDVAALINWLRGAGRAEEALRWSSTLAPDLVLAPIVATARAECLITLTRWADLQTLVETSNWKDREYARLAYRSRAARERGDDLTASASWEAALHVAKSRDQISQLAWMAHRWQRPEELRKTLWEAARQAKPEWALQMLHGLYRQDGDMEGMLRVARALLERDEKNAQARNNVAMLSLLLQKDAPKALETARILHEQAPTNATFASTYAFALHVGGRSAEGLAVLKRLSPEQLQDPGVAAYYALLLHANGADSEAPPYLELAKKATLLPAEKNLLAPMQR